MRSLARFGLGGLCVGAWAATSASQQPNEPINESFEGIFGPKIVAGASVGDTLRVRDYVMTLVHHRGGTRQECRADFSRLQVETGLEAGVIQWQCSSGPLRPDTFAGFDDRRDSWTLRVGGSDGSSILFARIGRKVSPDDLKPRAVQPDSAYANRVVGEVRALYARIADFPCAPPGADRDELESFTVCRRGAWIGRVVLVGEIEATRTRQEFTYDSTGRLRFLFRSSNTNGDIHHSRLYFADDRLVRLMKSRGNERPVIVNPSAERWAYWDSTSRSLAAACLATARRLAPLRQVVSVQCIDDP